MLINVENQIDHYETYFVDFAQSDRALYCQLVLKKNEEYQAIVNAKRDDEPFFLRDMADGSDALNYILNFEIVLP